MKKNLEAEAEKILLTNYEKYYRLAYSYVNNEQDALDIVQESAYKVMKDISKVREPDYLSTWIYRVVMNTAVDFLRKRQKESWRGWRSPTRMSIMRMIRWSFSSHWRKKTVPSWY